MKKVLTVSLLLTIFITLTSGGNLKKPDKAAKTFFKVIQKMDEKSIEKVIVNKKDFAYLMEQSEELLRDIEQKVGNNPDSMYDYAHKEMLKSYKRCNSRLERYLDGKSAKEMTYVKYEFEEKTNEEKSPFTLGMFRVYFTIGDKNFAAKVLCISIKDEWKVAEFGRILEQ